MLRILWTLDLLRRFFLISRGPPSNRGRGDPKSYRQAAPSDIAGGPRHHSASSPRQVPLQVPRQVPSSPSSSASSSVKFRQVGLRQVLSSPVRFRQVPSNQAPSSSVKSPSSSVKSSSVKLRQVPRQVPRQVSVDVDVGEGVTSHSAAWPDRTWRKKRHPSTVGDRFEPANARRLEPRLSRLSGGSLPSSESPFAQDDAKIVQFERTSEEGSPPRDRGVRSELADQGGSGRGCRAARLQAASHHFPRTT